jgi:hypothetical protein
MMLHRLMVRHPMAQMMSNAPVLTVAIHPDEHVSPGGIVPSSTRWSKYLEASGFIVRPVDVRSADILDQLTGCHAFMWRWVHFGGMGRIARRLLPVIERELRIPVFPDQHTCWHFDDKIAQAYLLKALQIPIPKTWIWFDQRQAKEWASRADYPLVFKLATGAQSANVRLIKNALEARSWIDRLFSFYIMNLDDGEPSIYRKLRRIGAILIKNQPWPVSTGYEFDTGFVLFQEFLPNNPYDTRVTVVGHRAFAFRRFNRPDDFRASGSANFDVDPTKIDEKFVRLAFLTSRKLGSQSCAIDGLYRGRDPLIGEVQYSFVSSAAHSCPGHWELDGEPQTGTLNWVAGQMWPEEAQVIDFIAEIRRRYDLRSNDVMAP